MSVLGPTDNPTDPAHLPAGISPNRAMNDAIMAAWIAGGKVALTQAQYLAITGPAPVYPTTLKRYPDFGTTIEWGH